MQQHLSEDSQPEFLSKIKELSVTASKFLQVYISNEISNREKHFYIRQFTIEILMGLAQFSINKDKILSISNEKVTELINSLPVMYEKKILFSSQIMELQGLEILPTWAYKSIEKEMKESGDEEMLMGAIYTIYVLLANVINVDKGVIKEMRNLIFNDDNKRSNAIRGFCLRAYCLVLRNPDLSWARFTEDELNVVYNWFYGEDEMKLPAGFAATILTEEGDFILPLKVLEECVKTSMKYRQNLFSYNCIISLCNSLLPEDFIATEEIVNPIIEDFPNHTDEATKAIIITLIDNFGRHAKIIDKGVEIAIQDLNNPEWGFNIGLSTTIIAFQVGNHELKMSEETFRNVEKNLDNSNVDAISITYALECILSHHEAFQLLDESCYKIASLIFNTPSQVLKNNSLSCLKQAVNNLQVLEERVITMLLPLYEDTSQEIVDSVAEIFEKNTMNLSLK